MSETSTTRSRATRPGGAVAAGRHWLWLACAAAAAGGAGGLHAGAPAAPPAPAVVLDGAAAPSRPAAAVPAPRWPLDLPPVLTSSFGEYRPNRFHAGIDFATRGAVGAVCRAVGDGSVVRMRMSPFGYGKALYIQLDSGPLVVYAHLSRFAEPMAQRARSEQKRLARYSFDLALAPGAMRVAAGDVVAWSGQTGVGVPHLHFEMRDGDVARNPQTAGFAVADRIAPAIADVRLVPLDAASHVDGGLAPRLVRRSGSPLVAGGRLGVTLRASDRAAADSHRQTPYRLELRVDDRMLYRIVHERFDYADNHHLILEYDAERLLAGERVQRLYRIPGNRLSGRDAATGTDGVVLAAVAGAGDAALQLAPGLHTIEIEVADVAGNVTAFRAPLRVVPPPRLHLTAVDEGDGWRWTCDTDVSGFEPDSLRLAVDATRDGGRTWAALAAGAPAPAGTLRRWSGALAAGPPPALRARLRDHGNVVATVTWAERSGAESEAPLAVTSKPRFDLRGWLQVDVVPEALLRQPPEVIAIRRDGSQVALVVEQSDTRAYRATAALIELVPDVAAIELRVQAIDGRRTVRRDACVARVVRRGAAARIDDLAPGIVIEVPAGAAFDDVAWRIETADPPRPAGELSPAGPAWRIAPRGAAFDKAFRVAVAGAPTSGAGLFAIESGKSPQFVSADRDGAGALVYESRAVSDLAVMADATPPVIRGPRLIPRGKRPQRLRVVVTDGGAGLGDGGIRAEVNGTAAIPEWDPETGEVWIDAETRLAPGTHRLRVVAVDRLGNRSDRTLPFAVR